MSSTGVRGQRTNAVRYLELGEGPSGLRATLDSSPGRAWDVAAVLRLRIEALFGHVTDGALIKRAVLRVFHVGESTPGQQRLTVCELETPMVAEDGAAVWRGDGLARPEVVSEGAGACTTAVGPRPGWIVLDVTEMLRRQVARPQDNQGFWFRATGPGTIDLVSPSADDVELRPRLAVSCHGDNNLKSHGV